MLYLSFADERRRNGELMMSKRSSLLDAIPEALLEQRSTVAIRSSGRSAIRGGGWRTGGGRSWGTAADKGGDVREFHDRRRPPGEAAPSQAAATSTGNRRSRPRLEPTKISRRTFRPSTSFLAPACGTESSAAVRSPISRARGARPRRESILTTRRSVARLSCSPKPISNAETTRPPSGDRYARELREGRPAGRQTRGG